MRKDKKTQKTINSIEIDLERSNHINSFCCLKNIEISELSHTNKLSLDEIKNLVVQANKLGAKKVTLYNNPSKPHPDTAKIVSFINENNMQSESCLTAPCNEPSINSDTLVIACVKHKNSCFINLEGSVYPCIGMPLSIGSIHKNSLEKILRDSEVMANLKNHALFIKGPCRRCDKFSHCYGCRARAFLLTGDYLASDPKCTKNQDKLDQITYLPFSVEKLLPQKSGMRVVTKLLKVEERYARVESIFSKESPYIKEDKSLEEIAYMEVMAQSAGTMDGFEKFDTDMPDPKGFLIGGQNINIYAKTYAGDKLIIDIYKTTKFGNFGILKGTIHCKDVLIAEGEVKVFQTDGGENEN